MRRTLREKTTCQCRH
ncbi:hypothetical protein E1B77_09935 [Salmonella enterica subsp. enterica]|nr:hypothetical protein [Salmonella enterica subsp. enterica]